MFSIIIPTLNNVNYLKLCIDSIKKNSNFNHEIIVHVNQGTDGTLEYLNENKIKYTYTEYNSGICYAVNTAARKATEETGRRTYVLVGKYPIGFSRALSEVTYKPSPKQTLGNYVFVW